MTLEVMTLGIKKSQVRFSFLQGIVKIMDTILSNLKTDPVDTVRFETFLRSRVAGWCGPLLKMASNPNMSDVQLDVLSKQRDINIRQAVAVNPSTPDSTLMRMSKSKDERIHEFLESNDRYRILKGFEPLAY